MNTTESISTIVKRIGHEVHSVIVGHEQSVEMLIGAFLIGGHVLLEGPPGIAKTLLARSVAQALGLSFKRIQFTPDLMPSDITGVNVFDPKSGTFHFAQGPLFADIVLADEINRTPPKTQSALLEAMEERSVTTDGTLRRLGEYFFVVATQNPIEHEGTFPLPEAQLDRFIFKLHMGYPSAEQERGIIDGRHGKLLAESDRTLQLNAVVTGDQLQQARTLLRQIAFSPSMSEYVTAIARATREHPDLALGVSPRGTLYLALAAKMHAALDGRDYTIPDDVKAVAFATMNHRLIFKPEVFESARSAATLVQEVLERIPTPSR